MSRVFCRVRRLLRVLIVMVARRAGCGDYIFTKNLLWELISKDKPEKGQRSTDEKNVKGSNSQQGKIEPPFAAVQIRTCIKSLREASCL